MDGIKFSYENMKKIIFAFMTVSLLLLLSGCDLTPKYEEKYQKYASPATLTKESSGEVIFVTDDAMRLHPDKALVAPDSIIGLRYFINYQIVENTPPDYKITLLSQQSMPVDTIMLFSGAIPDSIANDGISKMNVWVAGKYLNMLVNFYGSGKKEHSFRLIDVKGDDGVNFELRHDNADDAVLTELQAAQSFDLSPYLSDFEGKTMKMTIKFRHIDGSDMTIEKNINLQ